MTIATLIVDVAANTVKLQQDVNKIQGSLDSVGSMAGKLGTLMAGAFTVTAITGAAMKVLDYAGKINDLAAQTGLSTRAIQEMQHAAGQTGASLENFTNAAFKLGVNLAGGSNSVQGAVERLGLSYLQLRQMSPDQQFNTIATALGGVQSAQERNKLAVELFGKAAKDILPAIAQGYDNIAKSALIAGDDQLKALDMAGDALSSFWDGLMSVGTQVLGGLVITGREVIRLTGLMQDLAEVGAQTGTYLEAAGLKTMALPKAFNEARVTAGLLPAPLKALSMSLEEQHRVERALTEQIEKKIDANKAALKAQEDMTRAQERFAASVKNSFYTIDYYVQLKKAVQEASFELEELPSSAAIAANGFAPFHAAVSQSRTSIVGWGETWRETMAGLPNVIMSAIQGGGSAIGAAGSFIGVSMMTKFSERFGPAIKAALPFGIGEAVTALLPTLGALFGPVAEKIAGFFRSIFGGPSAEELRGRQAVADFEKTLASLLTQTQLNESGNVGWKNTVIAIRDAYLAAGKTEAEALAAAEALWASSKLGANAVESAIAAINAVLQSTGTVSTTTAGQLASGFVTVEGVLNTAADAAGKVARFVGDVGNSLNGLDRDIDIAIRTHYEDGEVPGFASGSGGIRDFGSGTPVMLHGRERVQTERQMRAEKSGGGGDGLIEDVRRLIRDLPRAMAVAVDDAMVLQGARR